MWVVSAAEAFDDALGRGFADQREARREAGEVALAWAVFGGMVAAVSGAQCDAAGGADGPRAEAVRDRRGDGLAGGEAVAACAGGVAEALGVSLPDGRERLQPVGVDGRPFRAIGGPGRRGRGGAAAAIVRLGRRGCQAVRRGQGGAPQPQAAVHRAAVAPDRRRRGSVTPALDRAAHGRALSPAAARARRWGG